jgi:hypothetical protein
MSLFSLQILFEIFPILRIIQRDIFINVHKHSYKYLLFFVRFLWNLNFLDSFSKSTQMSHLTKIRPVGPEFLADGRKDSHEEDSSRFSKFCESA